MYAWINFDDKPLSSPNWKNLIFFSLSLYEDKVNHKGQLDCGSFAYFGGKTINGLGARVSMFTLE